MYLDTSTGNVCPRIEVLLSARSHYVFCPFLSSYHSRSGWVPALYKPFLIDISSHWSNESNGKGHCEQGHDVHGYIRAQLRTDWRCDRWSFTMWRCCGALSCGALSCRPSRSKVSAVPLGSFPCSLAFFCSLHSWLALILRARRRIYLRNFHNYLVIAPAATWTTQ